MTTQKVSQVAEAAQGKWPVILQMLRIDLPENGRHGPCPKCGGKDRFRLDDLDGRGTWICSQCGNGDGLDLVKLVTGYSVRKAAQEVAQVLLWGLPLDQLPGALLVVVLDLELDILQMV